ncbi:MAG: YbjN domain-containing protein [Bacteroidia bacterium]|nr:YbjN domain-containing protein [Bacteroidia bacterium]
MESDLRKKLERGIERFLRKSSLKYSIDKDGDYHLILGFEEFPAQVRVFILREGLQGEILSIIARYEGIERPIGEQEALSLANRWNQEHRWPRVYWKEGYFYADFHLDVECGISQKLLELTLHRLLMGIVRFLLYLVKGEDLLSQELRKWLLGYYPRLN